MRFWRYLNEAFPETVIRSKGLFWIASRPNDAINFSQAGGSSRIEKAGIWWCSMPYSERIRYQSFVDNKNEIEKKWDQQWGDRLTELVFIGQDLKKAEIVLALENCLLNKIELEKYKSGATFEDPFPQAI
jgi:G3E family GTPase